MPNHPPRSGVMNILLFRKIASSQTKKKGFLRLTTEPPDPIWRGIDHPPPDRIDLPIRPRWIWPGRLDPTN